MIFYDDPMLGPYQGWFDQIYAEPRTTDPAVNRAYFAAEARQAEAARKPLDWWLARAPYNRDPAGFTAVYQRFYALMARLAEPG